MAKKITIKKTDKIGTVYGVGAVLADGTRLPTKIYSNHRPTPSKLRSQK